MSNFTEIGLRKDTFGWMFPLSSSSLVGGTNTKSEEARRGVKDSRGGA